ncbi:hypothetical protein CG709_05020, partial [Lachnotalea glycerini]
APRFFPSLFVGGVWCVFGAGFIDYFLFPILCTAVGIAIVVSLCWHILHKSESILYVAVVDDILNDEETQKVEQELEKIFNNGTDRTFVTIDDSFYTDGDGLNKLEVYLSNHQIDLVIANEEVIRTFAGYGFMQDLNTVLEEDELERNTNQFLYAAGYKENDDISFEDKETGQGEILPYGVNIADSAEYKKLGTILKNPVVGIANNAKNMQNAKIFLKWLNGERIVEK